MTRNRKNRVVVTGIGVVSPLGNSSQDFVTRLLAGESGGGPITLFDPANLPTRIAAEVKGFAGHSVFSKDRKIGFALGAARQACEDAGYTPEALQAKQRAGLSLGIGLELFSMDDLIADRCGKIHAAEMLTALTHLQTPSDLCVPLIGREFGLMLPPATHVSACAAATDAIGEAFWRVRRGQCDWMLAGGTDSMINPLGVGGFCRLAALSKRNDEPKRASRPFDKERDGFLLGEGAALLLVESLTSAQNRGARIYGEIVGYGNSFDAHGISEPHPEGAGALLAMRRALNDAGIVPADVVHVNAHGTSTPKNDVVETLAIKTLFGGHAKRLTVNATKSLIGHLISASGAVEVAALLGCARAGFLHPTINIKDPDDGCDLDYVADGKRPAKAGYYLKNSFAFGGQNAALVFKIGDHEC